MIGLGALFIYFRKKIKFINLVVLFGTLVLCSFLAETFLRLTEKKQPQLKIAMENPNRTGSYKLIPKLTFAYPYHGKEVLIKTNSHGMRWKEVDFGNPLKKKRIAFVGDSMTFGESADKIENSFVGIFESLTDLDKFEALNFGVVGYGLYDMEVQIKEDILPFKPDYIILMFFNGNDFRDTYLGVNKYDVSTGVIKWNTSVLNSKLPLVFRKPEKADSTEQKPALSVENLRLYGLFGKGLLFLQSLLGHEGAEVIDQVKPRERLNEEKKESAFLVSNDFTSFTFWSQRNYPEVGIKAKEHSLQVLGNIKDFCNKNDIRLFIVSIPFEEQVYAKSLLGTDSNGVEYNINLPQKYVEKWDSLNSVPYFDLLPALRSYVQQKNAALYPDQDVHFNNEGHYVVGKLLANFFEKNILEH